MTSAGVSVQSSRVRFLVLTMLFAVTAVNYADRAALSIAGPAAARQLHFDSVALGFVFSAFGWSYVLGQVPGGWLMDRFGSKLVYGLSILFWSVFTFLQGFVVWVPLAWAFGAMLALQFLLGLAEPPSFPGNARIVAAWFPAAERGTASAVFNSGQYFAPVLFGPLAGWITQAFGWPWVFRTLGALGLVMAAAWVATIHSPNRHPRIQPAELEYIAEGGGVIDMDSATRRTGGPRAGYLKQLLANRMLLGIYVAQYSITTLTYFFLTWFPVYLVEARGLSILKAGIAASLPAICGFLGNILGGIFSDVLLRRGWSLTAARKTPILLGTFLALSMILCNYVNVVWMVVALMALAFFGKGLGALGWAVISDTAPREIAGLSGGVFNTFGNTAAITTPIVIGYIVRATGSFHGALLFVAGNAVVVMLSYLVVVGEIRRVELRKSND